MTAVKILNKTFYAFILIIFGTFSMACSAQNTGNDSSANSNDSSSEVYGSKEIHKNFKVEKGQKLNIDLKTGGAISITGWDKDEVQVDAEIGGDDWEDFLVTFEKSSSGLEIYSKYKHHHDNENSRANFEIKVPSKFDLVINTMGGEVNIDSVEGSMQGKTMGGGLTLSHLKGSLDLSTMGGNVSLTNSEVDGNVHTMGGTVDFENITGDVKGSSMGGSIKIDEVDGSVNATTLGGDVNVKEVCSPNDGDRDIELESNGGDITLIVPKDFSMDVDITLAYTKSHEGDYKIISDFDLSRTQNDNWDHHNGSARKYLYGKASLNGGKNKVTIKTINGDVHLQKAE